jgi:hypothetical protein
MENFFNQPDDIENIVTPESLAWKLLMDDDVENYAGILLPFVSEDNTADSDKTKEKQFNVRYDSLSDQFQILITVYMEMVFSMLKINHVGSYIDENGNIDESIDLEATFKPDLINFTVDGMIDIFREKLKKIRIFLSVLGIYDSKENLPKDYGSSSDYFCRIILRDSTEGKAYFKANKNWLDPEKRYTFVMRNNNKKNQKKLDDFYAVCTLPNIKVKISFSKINVITQNQHMV